MNPHMQTHALMHKGKLSQYKHAEYTHSMHKYFESFATSLLSLWRLPRDDHGRLGDSCARETTSHLPSETCFAIND